MAARVGVQQPVIARIESGAAQNLELRTLTRIATGLGVRVRVSFEEVAPAPRRRKRRAA